MHLYMKVKLRKCWQYYLIKYSNLCSSSYVIWYHDTSNTESDHEFFYSIVIQIRNFSYFLIRSLEVGWSLQDPYNKSKNSRIIWFQYNEVRHYEENRENNRLCDSGLACLDDFQCHLRCTVSSWFLSWLLDLHIFRMWRLCFCRGLIE
jgi:hypothetical protein